MSSSGSKKIGRQQNKKEVKKRIDKKELMQEMLSMKTCISVSVAPRVTAVARKDPGHSAKSAGGRLQLNTHTSYVCGFA